MPLELSALIIDNNKVTRKSMLSILRQGLGIKTVGECENAQLALHFLKEAKDVNLVFIDYETVGSVTFELVSRAKKLTGNNEMKFVLLASTANKDFLLEAASNGINAFILKPYNAKAVVEKVNKITASKAQRSSQRLTLLEAIDVKLLIKQHTLNGALIDISSGGCLLKTERLGHAGLDIYDELTIRIPFGVENVDMASELIRVERDTTSENKKVSAAFVFKQMSQEVALQFAKLWATLLRNSEAK